MSSGWPDPMIAGFGTALVLACVVAYYAYAQSVIAAPGFAHALRPLLGGPRRLLLVVGVFAALLGVVLEPEGPALVAGVVAAIGMRHATRRQWAFGLRPTPAMRLTGVEPTIPVVALPDGRAVPVHWLEKARLVHLGDTLVVGCSIARSVAAFRAPEGPVLVQFPLAVGFAIGRGRELWSGATGEALGLHEPLELVDLDLTTARDAKQVFGPVGGVLPDPSPPRRVRIPGANAEGRAEVVTVTDARGGRRHLARWADEL